MAGFKEGRPFHPLSSLLPSSTPLPPSPSLLYLLFVVSPSLSPLPVPLPHPSLPLFSVTVSPPSHSSSSRAAEGCKGALVSPEVFSESSLFSTVGRRKNIQLVSSRRRCSRHERDTIKAQGRVSIQSFIVITVFFPNGVNALHSLPLFLSRVNTLVSE